MTMDDQASAAALKDELLSSLGRWRAELPAENEPGNTMGFGVANRAIAIAGSLIRAAVDTMMPDEPLPEKPTLGERIGILERRGQKMRTSCSAPSERLVTKADIGVIHRFSKQRNALAHQEEARAEAWELGRFTRDRVTEILDLVESIARMTIVSETICVQKSRPGAQGSHSSDSPEKV
jgi:hypothetical protein